MKELPPPPVVLDRLISEQTIAQFAVSGVELVVSPAGHQQPARAELAGIIGFTSPSLRGTLMIVSSFALFSRSRPEGARSEPLSGGTARDWLYLRDWASELANQLMGRLKNRLTGFGLHLSVSTPTALSGAALAFGTPASKRAIGHRFTSDTDELWVFFDAVVDPDLVMSPKDGDGAAAAEGDIILF
jgi:chemotaxis protein CheX